MKIILVLMALVVITGCSSTQPKPTSAQLLQVKRDAIIECVKELKLNESTTADSFEVCRQIYHLEKLPDVGQLK